MSMVDVFSPDPMISSYVHLCQVHRERQEETWGKHTATQSSPGLVCDLNGDQMDHHYVLLIVQLLVYLSILRLLLSKTKSFVEPTPEEETYS